MDMRSMRFADGGAELNTHAELPVDVLGMELAADFDRLTVVLADRDGGAREHGSMVCAHIATPLLRSRASELFQVVCAGSRVQLMLDALQAAMSGCARQLTDTGTAFDEKLQAFSALLRDHGCDSTPAGELMSLLATGVSRYAPLGSCITPPRCRQ